MSEQYRLMIHFAIATLHFYRKDITEPEEGENLDVFLEKHEDVIKRVNEEALNLFNYELSHEQIRKAVMCYCYKPLSVYDTKASTLN